MQNTDFLYHIRIQLYGILYFLFTLHTVIIPLCLHYTAIFETMFVLSSVMAVSIAVMRSLATTFTMVIPLHTVIAVFIQLVSSITVFHYADEFRRNFRDMGKGWMQYLRPVVQSVIRLL